MDEKTNTYSGNTGEFSEEFQNENSFSLDEISDEIERESRRLDGILLLPQI